MPDGLHAHHCLRPPDRHYREANRRGTAESILLFQAGHRRGSARLAIGDYGQRLSMPDVLGAHGGVMKDLAESMSRVQDAPVGSARPEPTITNDDEAAVAAAKTAGETVKQPYVIAPRVQDFVKDRPSLRRLLKRLIRIGARDEQWSRVVMNRQTREMINRLNPGSLDVLEISGDDWAARMKFKSYRSVGYPEFNICESTLDDRFDLIIAEQVFEHVLWPYRSGRNVYAMLNPGGHFLITTPFLVRIHNFPTDCSRWTETGMRYFLAECGFSLDRIQTGSWGNRACVRANFSRWWEYRRLFHSLRNEPAFPISVWAVARK